MVTSTNAMVGLEKGEKGGISDEETPGRVNSSRKPSRLLVELWDDGYRWASQP